MSPPYIYPYGLILIAMPVMFNNGFDKLLGGGIQDGIITHIYGPPASGKTNLAIIAAVNAQGLGKVVYVDPEGGFSVERLKQISGERFKDVLNNIILVQPTTFEEQKAAIAKLDEVVNSMKVSLVIVDSIAMLYRMEEDKDVRMLGRTLAQLLRLARKYNLPVLLTNQVYSEYDTNTVRPIGGTITEYFTKNIIEVSRGQDHVRRAIVRRHSHGPEGQTLTFRIVQTGIETAESEPAQTNSG
jgi:DNA repair protein RadB